MKIFDSHTHIFPDKIAEKASENIGDFYSLKINNNGTIGQLLERNLKNNVSGCLVCSVATVAKQVTAINDFIARSVGENDTFVGLCSLHPDMTDIELDSEIKRSISLGLKGIKLHPDFQQFEADSVKAFSLYEVVDGRLPILIHSGDKRFDFSSPKRVSKILKRFPDLTVIAAHLGGWSEWEDAALALAKANEYGNLYVDSSSSLYALPTKKAREYISVFGEDYVLFGTDYPMWDIEEELRLFADLNLPVEVGDKIMYENASRLFKF